MFLPNSSLYTVLMCCSRLVNVAFPRRMASMRLPKSNGKMAESDNRSVTSDNTLAMEMWSA